MKFTDAEKALLIEKHFSEVVFLTLDNKEFVQNYDRLRGTNISKTKSRTPIEQMIDEVTGKEKEELFKFFDFVLNYVFLPVMDTASKENDGKHRQIPES